MNAHATADLKPAFEGFVQSSGDALVLFEACLNGTLHHVSRRPHDRERSQLIKSGNIFIYEENTSGIKRWTDGVAWSPSRTLGNFLVYRELDKPFPPGAKKRATKRKRNSPTGAEGFQRSDLTGQQNVEMTAHVTPSEPPISIEVKPGLSGYQQGKELERSLIGSLVDSYGFRADGLVKKTMTVSVNGVVYHMVSYYKVDDVKYNVLARPFQDPRLQYISIRPELLCNQNFRAPIEETEHYAIDGQTHALCPMIHSMVPSYQRTKPWYYIGDTQYPGVYAPMATTSATLAATYPQYGSKTSCATFYGLGPQLAARYDDMHPTTQGVSSNSFYHANNMVGASMNATCNPIPGILQLPDPGTRTPPRRPSTTAINCLQMNLQQVVQRN
ncbi:hypothetical protein WHR41_09294 [Cladosporium halotolerans]|uniref:Uncharacterized protein n=1 Tax=Cladosporium halotolerans TaxID=1052096 RepID=A0AB34KAT0_9PEZI